MLSHLEAADANRIVGSRYHGTVSDSPLIGCFIVLEGIEGSGKTTAARHLVGTLNAAGYDSIMTREPGGSPIGERIRDLLLDGQSAEMAAETEALLFAAARAQHVREVIGPAVQRGRIVVCDRFTDSSLAYQWGGRGLAKDAVLAAQELATGGLEPDLKLLLDLPVEAGLQRRASDDGARNRLDNETFAFHERVRRAYHELVGAESHRWRVIDADRDPVAVWSEIQEEVFAFLANAGNKPGEASIPDPGNLT